MSGEMEQNQMCIRDRVYTTCSSDGFDYLNLLAF